jgi:hypothetical protein
MIPRLQAQKRQLHASEEGAALWGLSKPLVFVSSGFNSAAQDAVEHLAHAIAALLSSTVLAKGNQQVKALADILNDVYFAATRPKVRAMLSKSMFLCHA